MRNTKVCVALPLEARKTLLGEADLSSSAAAAVEHPFDNALTAAIAMEIIGKCRRFGLSSAAEILQTAVTALSSNGHRANGFSPARDELLVSSRRVGESDAVGR